MTARKLDGLAIHHHDAPPQKAESIASAALSARRPHSTLTPPELVEGRNGIDPKAWLTDTLTRLAAGHGARRLGELMQWNYSAAVA